MPQLTPRQQQLLEIGIQKGLLRVTGSRIEYINQAKSYNFEDPEEVVRAVTYVELVERYQYPAERIEPEVMPPSRQPPYPADLVVYKDDAQSQAFIVVECKPTSQPTDLLVGRREGLGNANLFAAGYLFIAAGEVTT